MALLATYVPYSELNDGKPSTLSEFYCEVARFSRSPLLHLCCAMNIALRSTKETINVQAHDALVETFFEPHVANHLLRKYGDVRIVFHRQQILFVAKTAILQCRDDGLVPGPLQFQQIGKLFLMASDHLPNVGGTPEALDDKFAYLATQLLPVQEAAECQRFDHKVARSFMMLSQSGPKLRDRNLILISESASKELLVFP